jgi:plastocyanin
MRRTLQILALALAAAAILALVGCSSTPAATTPAATTPAPATGGVSAGAKTVSISNFAFDPADLTVKVGDSVTWTNNDSVAHTVTFADFKSDQLAPGATYSHTFDKAGAFDYTCSIHPQMAGKITVQ